VELLCGLEAQHPFLLVGHYVMVPMALQIYKIDLLTLTTSQTPNHRHFLASTSGYQGSDGGKAELGQAPTQHISSYGFGGSGDTQEKRDYVLERATGECNVGLSGPPIDSSGNQSFGQAHENRPPYYALAFIMRVS
jgi:microcystin-dependent protein